MFGADTPLVMDALQMVAVALIVGGGTIYMLMRKRSGGDASKDSTGRNPGDLEERVRVLERIATDQSIGLADEIEALRETSALASKPKGATQ